jgi:outer membrane protein assembly factor BamB
LTVRKQTAAPTPSEKRKATVTMRRRVWWIFLALGLFAPRATPVWAQRVDFTGFADEEALRRHNLVRQWYLQLPSLGQRERVTTLKVLEDLLLVQTNKGQIHCLDAETGKVQWSAVVGRGDTEAYPPAVTPDFVYVVSGDTLAALDRAKGGILWTRTLPGVATAGPGANDSYVYVHVSDHRIYAVSLKDDLGRKFTKRPVAWFLQADGALENPPIVLDDRVAIISSAGTVYALPHDSRRLFYRFYTQAKNSAPLATLGSLLYVATTDYDLFAIELHDGRMKWRFPSGFPIHAKPIPFVDHVYVTPLGAGLYCLSNENGRVQWFNPHATRVIAVSQSHVYAADRINNFLILSRQDGHELASWLAPAFTISTDNQFTDRIYIGTETGLLVCLREPQNVTPYQHPQEPLSPRVTEPTEMPEDESAKGTKSDKSQKSRGFFDDVEEKLAPPKKAGAATAPKKEQPSSAPKSKSGSGAEFFKGLFDKLKTKQN